MGNAELLGEVVLREGPDLKPDGNVAGDQAVDPGDRRRELLHGEYGGQAGSVARLDDQNDEQPYDDHEAAESAPGVLSCINIEERVAPMSWKIPSWLLKMSRM